VFREQNHEGKYMTKGTFENEEKEIEWLFDELTTILCYRCWHATLQVEDKEKLSKRLWKWYNGQYSDNQAAIERISKELFKATKKVELKTAKQIFKEFDSRFYYRIIGGKKPRVDMPKEWYDEIKARFLEKKSSV